MRPLYPIVLLLIVLISGIWYFLHNERGGDNRPAGQKDKALIAAPEAPKEHFAITDGAALSPEQAMAVYDELKAQMRGDYALSALPAARRYPAWQRVNEYPYRSTTHGSRYVNNFANPPAIGAGYPGGGTMPAGAIIAKDSFTVKKDGEHYPGALFIMEKLKSGLSPETGDWRFVMVLPDGSIFGDSQGDNAAATAFCAECHARRADHDYLFGVPEEARRR